MILQSPLTSSPILWSFSAFLTTFHSYALPRHQRITKKEKNVRFELQPNDHFLHTYIMLRWRLIPLRTSCSWRHTDNINQCCSIHH